MTRVFRLSKFAGKSTRTSLCRRVATSGAGDDVAGSECYNPPLPVKFKLCLPTLLCLLLLGAQHGVAQSSTPDFAAATPDWNQPAHELAEKIIGHMQSRSAVFLSFRNLSSLDAAEAADARRALEAQLRAAGVRFVPADQAVDEVEATLSENVRQYLWVAQVGRGDSHQVVMVTSPRASLRSARASGTMSLLRTPLIAQPRPILDAALVSGDALLVQDAAGLTLYRAENGRWRIRSTVAVPHARPWPRDLRGRLLLRSAGSNAASFAAFYPGLVCNGATAPDLNADCGPSDDPWPLTADGSGARGLFNPARNYFSALLSPASTAQPAPAGTSGAFFSAARLPDDTWVAAATDGTVRFTGSAGPRGSAIAGWGSDLAVVASRCGSGTQIVSTQIQATRAAATPDALRIFEWIGGRVSEAGAPLQFAGPITALWPASDGNHAVVVSRDTGTGEYEAAVVSVLCGR